MNKDENLSAGMGCYDYVKSKGIKLPHFLGASPKVYGQVADKVTPNKASFVGVFKTYSTGNVGNIHVGIVSRNGNEITIDEVANVGANEEKGIPLKKFKKKYSDEKGIEFHFFR